MFNNFSGNSRAGQTTNENITRCMSCVCWMKQGYHHLPFTHTHTHTHTVCDTYCFSLTTMFAQTRLNFP